MDRKTNKQGIGRDRWSAEADKKTDKRSTWMNKQVGTLIDRQGTRMDRQGTGMGRQTDK